MLQVLLEALLEVYRPKHEAQVKPSVIVTYKYRAGYKSFDSRLRRNFDHVALMSLVSRRAYVLESRLRFAYTV